jgi:hypothetical protein
MNIKTIIREVERFFEIPDNRFEASFRILESDSMPQSMLDFLAGLRAFCELIENQSLYHNGIAPKGIFFLTELLNSVLSGYNEPFKRLAIDIPDEKLGIYDENDNEVSPPTYFDFDFSLLDRKGELKP